MMTEPKTKLDITELNRRYQTAESCDSELFAEQRSNVLLVSGDHYTRRGSRFWNRIRDTKQLSSEQKIRLTKNHIQKITLTYTNNITSHAPGVQAVPKNETELAERKAAELNQAVIKHWDTVLKMKKKKRSLCEDYVNIGEAFIKVFFNPSAGRLKGYLGEIDENGMPVLDEMGNQAASKTPVFTGEMEFKRYFGFNVLRDEGSKSLDESPYMILRDMAAISELKAMIENDPELDDEEKKIKLGYLKEGNKDSFLVFDGSRGEYTKSKDQVLVMEHHYRACPDYPEGYFFICTEYGILFEGSHPFGVWPIKYVGFDEIPTTPRARSKIKVLRPYQAEINRCASQMATHQITLGDDKLLIQSGTKITHGGQLPGVRAVQYTGAPPGFLPGRSGEQYLSTMQAQISEMYQVSNVYEDSEEIKANMEPFSLLWRSIRNKKKFSFYGEKFEDFLVDMYETGLELAKHYYTEDHLISAVGKREYINISEFQNTDPLTYQIKVVPRTEDMESMMGKQIQMNHILQYVGAQLKPEDIGRMLKSMPFMDGEEAFGDMTIDYENAVNDVLALDRGQYPVPNPNDNHEYLVKRLTHRMKQSDYQLLSPQIQANYDRKLKEHEGFVAFAQEKILHAQSGYIPTGGYMVVCDIYVPDPKDPSKTRRARVPYESLDWLIKRLEEQGSSLERLETLPKSALAGIADQMGGAQQPAGQEMPPAQPMDPGVMRGALQYPGSSQRLQ